MNVKSPFSFFANTPFKFEVSKLVCHDMIKRTVAVILRDIPFKEELLRFITVQLKQLNLSNKKNYMFFQIYFLISNCGFCVKVTCAQLHKKQKT